MSLAAAVDQIATWSLTGVTNIPLDEFQGDIAEADLPALLPILSGNPQEGFEALGFSASVAAFYVDLKHVLLITGLDIGRPSERFYQALALVDAYCTAASADRLLDDNLAEPLTFTIHIGPVELGGVLYYGIEFRHRWELMVAS